MTKLQRLNAYLTERLEVTVREILEVVENTVSEYREETARTRRENESLKRQLRDVLLVDEADLFGPAEPASLLEREIRREMRLSEAGSPAGQEEWRSGLGKEPETSAAQQNQNQRLIESSWSEEKPFIPGSVSVHKMEPDPELGSSVLTKTEEADVMPTTRESAMQTGSGNIHISRTPSRRHDSAASESSSTDVSDEDDTVEVGRMDDPQSGEVSKGGGDEEPQEDGPHLCPQCGKSFSQMKSLKSHRLIHRKLLGCNMCGKAFAQSIDLKRHLLTHSGERPHQCNLCPRSFAQLGNLRRHLRTHEGEKPHHCPLCAMAFSDEDSFKEHQCAQSREKPYCCAICGKSFTTAKGLQVHLRKDHPKERRVVTGNI